MNNSRYNKLALLSISISFLALVVHIANSYGLSYTLSSPEISFSDYKGTLKVLLWGVSILGVVGVVLGIGALTQITLKPENKKGKILALLGIVLGTIMTLWALFNYYGLFVQLSRPL